MQLVESYEVVKIKSENLTRLQKEIRRDNFYRNSSFSPQLVVFHQNLFCVCNLNKFPKITVPLCLFTMYRVIVIILRLYRSKARIVNEGRPKTSIRIILHRLYWVSTFFVLGSIRPLNLLRNWVVTPSQRLWKGAKWFEDYLFVSDEMIASSTVVRFPPFAPCTVILPNRLNCHCHSPLCIFVAFSSTTC